MSINCRDSNKDTIPQPSFFTLECVELITSALHFHLHRYPQLRNKQDIDIFDHHQHFVQLWSENLFIPCVLSRHSRWCQYDESAENDKVSKEMVLESLSPIKEAPKRLFTQQESVLWRLSLRNVQVVFWDLLTRRIRRRTCWRLKRISTGFFATHQIQDIAGELPHNSWRTHQHPYSAFNN